MAVARGVAAMLAEHWDALEGDWSIHHHRDLVADAFGPDQIGVRKLKVYIEALPDEDRVSSLRVTGLVTVEGRLDEIVREIAMGRSLLES